MKMPFFKLPKQAEKRNPIVGVIIGAAVALALGVCFHEKAPDLPVMSAVYDFVYSIEYKTYDLRFRIRGPLNKKHISREIVLLDYDNETEEWAPFPPDRAIYTEIIKAFSEKEARTRGTFFDIFFFDPFGQQLDAGMADVFQKTLSELPSAVERDNEITANLKQKMYEVYEILIADGSGERVAEAVGKLEEITSDGEAAAVVEYFKKAAEFFEMNQSMENLAPNRDIGLHDAIEAAGNVYLAQIVNNEEITPYGVDDVLFDPQVHKTFARFIRLQDRTKTETRLEVLVNYALRNMTVDDFDRLLRDSEKQSVGGLKPLKFKPAERAAITAESTKIRDDVEKAMELNRKFAVDIPKNAPVPKKRILDGYRKLINMTAPASFIAEGAAGIGYVKPEFQKYDGTVRTAAPASVFLDRLFLHIDLVLAMLYFDVGPHDLVFYKNKIVMKNCKRPGGGKPETITIPLFRNGTVLVNWAGKYYEPDQYEHRSFRAVYESAVKFNILKKQERGVSLNPAEQQTLASMSPEEAEKVKKDLGFFKGKISLTGLTAEGTHDLNPIPFHPRYPLVGMHANYLNMILSKFFIRATPFSIFIAIIIALSVFVGYMGGTRKQLPGALITIGAVAGYFAVCVLAFSYGRVWLPLMPVVITLATTYLLTLIYRFMTEGHEARRMKAMFSTYVNPSVVDTLIHNPDMLRLGGERMDLTAMFALASGPGIKTDDAEALVERLNEYFTAMTDQIFEHDGTLDKYEGNIIMAIFGAPVHFEDHSAKACLACVGMKKALAELGEKWKEEGKAPINITVGLNSGPMIAGNMGSASRFNYTIMGDSVNLSARILGASVQYGVSFMVSQYTYEKAKDAIVGRLVDNIVVVGKEEPVEVYEIVAGAGDKLPDDLTKFLEAYKDGFRLYRERKWDEAIERFNAALGYNPDDKPSKMLMDRCGRYKTSPPREGWKGEFALTAKGL